MTRFLLVSNKLSEQLSNHGWMFPETLGSRRQSPAALGEGGEEEGNEEEEEEREEEEREEEEMEEVEREEVEKEEEKRLDEGGRELQTPQSPLLHCSTHHSSPPSLHSSPPYSLHSSPQNTKKSYRRVSIADRNVPVRSESFWS